jgi:hypothetical protein
MTYCAVSTGLPRRDQQPRTTAAPTDQRPAQGRRDPASAAPDHRPSDPSADSCCTCRTGKLPSWLTGSAPIPESRSSAATAPAPTPRALVRALLTRTKWPIGGVCGIPPRRCPTHVVKHRACLPEPAATPAAATPRPQARPRRPYSNWKRRPRSGCGNAARPYGNCSTPACSARSSPRGWACTRTPSPAAPMRPTLTTCWSASPAPASSTPSRTTWTPDGTPAAPTRCD